MTSPLEMIREGIGTMNWPKVEAGFTGLTGESVPAGSMGVVDLAPADRFAIEKPWRDFIEFLRDQCTGVLCGESDLHEEARAQALPPPKPKARLKKKKAPAPATDGPELAVVEPPAKPNRFVDDR